MEPSNYAFMVAERHPDFVRYEEEHPEIKKLTIFEQVQEFERYMLQEHIVDFDEYMLQFEN